MYSISLLPLFLCNHPYVTSFQLTFITSDLTVNSYGDLVHLMCRADDHYDLCLFISPDGETCQLKWDTELQHPKIGSCSISRKFEFVGDYDKFECAVEIVADVGAVGKWKCYVREYRNFGQGRQDHAEIGLQVRKATHDNKTDKQPKPKKQAKLEPFMYKPIARIPVTKEEEEEEEEHGGVGTVVLFIILCVFVVSVVVIAVVWRRKGDFFGAKDDKMKMVQLQRENSECSFNSDK